MFVLLWFKSIIIMPSFSFQEAKKAAKLIKDRFGIDEVTYNILV